MESFKVTTNETNSTNAGNINQTDTSVQGIRGRFSQTLLLGIQRIQDPYYHGFAAQIAFFLLLSIVPLLLVLTQMLSFFDVPIDFAYHLMKQYMPGTLGTELSQWLFTSHSPAKSNIFFILLVVWAASRATFAMARIFNYTMTVGQSTGRRFLPERLRSLLTMLITVVVLSVILVILAYGDVVVNIVMNIIPSSKPMNVNPWLALRWPVALALYFLSISYIYYMLPSERMPFRTVIPGSIFSAVGMAAVTYLYSIYNNYALVSSNYNILYGSLASIVAMMFWFWFISWVICLGCLFNRVWIDTRPVTEEEVAEGT